MSTVFRLSRAPLAWPADPAPSALTIGNFDGVHRGHQALLEATVRAAGERGLVPTVLTFEPSPGAYFARGRGLTPPVRLQRLRDKVACLRALGVAHVCVARFDEAMASLPPEAFCETVLRQRLNVRWLIIGQDFRFGRGRTGDVAFLRTWAAGYGIELHVLPDVGAEGSRCSSSRVREALAAGDCATAAALLGRPYRISGRVAHGQKLGRALGFPTINIPLWSPPPISGVFAVRVHGIDVASGQAIAGAASAGVRPTVTSAGQPLLEVHLLDFSGNLYGKRVVVEFVEFLRPELRFSSTAEMVEQMHRDVARTRALLLGAA
ncbi:MAG: bifunctional riboflavin kinase/FAD synthetase [Casimicrobiaceae bacterium]